MNDIMIPWFTTKTEITVRRYQPPGRLPAGLLRNIAYRKLMDLRVISAEFNDNVVWFDQTFSLWLTKGNRSEGYAAFCSENQDNALDSNCPDVALCTCKWNLQSDFKGYLEAENKHDYLMSGDGSALSLKFFRSKDIGMKQVVEETFKVFANGFRLEERKEPIEDYNAPEYFGVVKLDFGYDGVDFTVSYPSTGYVNLKLEGIIQKWIRIFESTVELDGHQPNGDCKVGYFDSIWERANRATQNSTDQRIKI